MTIEDALQAHILASSEITVLIGNRVFADEAPQGVTTPFIVFQRISTVNTRALQRVVAQRVRMQVECWSDRKAQVLTLTKLLRGLFNGRGKVGQMDVIDAIAEDERSGAQTPFQLFSQQIDVFFLYKQ